MFNACSGIPVRIHGYSVMLSPVLACRLGSAYVGSRSSADMPFLSRSFTSAPFSFTRNLTMSATADVSGLVFSVFISNVLPGGRYVYFTYQKGFIEIITMEHCVTPFTTINVHHSYYMSLYVHTSYG